MKALFQLLILFLLQFVHTAEAYTLRGSIKDSTGVPVEFANVILRQKPDSAVVKAALSDHEGKFSFTDITPGNYDVLIFQMGYEKYYSDPVTIASADVELASIRLKPTFVQLNEAEIIAVRPLIEHKIDKTVINVENSIVNAGANALDILKRSPGVTVDNEGNIILSGKQGVLVMLDGKPTYLTQRDLTELLRNMTSDQIGKIEIITNPSAKYDAAGNSGIINIRLRKKQDTGFNGSVRGSYGQGVYPDFSSGITANYRTKSVNVFGRYDYTDGFFFERMYINRYFNQGEYRSHFEQYSFDKGNYNGHSFQAGTDIDLSEKHSIGFVAKGNLFDNYDRTRSNTNIYNNSASVDSTYTTLNENFSKWHNGSVNVNYRMKIDSTGSEWTIDLDRAEFSNSNDFYLTTKYFSGQQDQLKRSEAVKNIQPSEITISSFKTDFNTTLKGGLRFETGLKSSIVVTDNDARYYNIVDGESIADASKTNHFRYTENINAAYVNLAGEYHKFGYQFGLRAEQTIAKGEQLVTSENFDRNYTQLFPSLFINYKVNEKNVIGVSYGRRIDRPAYQQLNPFRFYIDPYNFNSGNPNLRPQMTNNFELKYNRGQASLAVNYSETRDAFAQIARQIDSVHVTYVTFENFRVNKNYGLTLSIPVAIRNWWQVSNNLNVFRNTFTGMTTVGFVNQSLTSYTFNTNNNIALPGDWALEVTAWYNSSMVWGTWKVKPMWSIGGGISKMFLKKTLQLRINYNDIFRKEITRADVRYENVDLNFKRIFDSRFVRFHVTYNFGNTAMKNRQHRTGSEDEQRRIQQGR